MVLNSRTLALLLALSVSGITALMLYLFDTAKDATLWTTALIAFISTYLLVVAAFEILVFREIRRAHKMLEKLKKKELDKVDNPHIILRPIRVINDEIRSYADRTQKEIDELRKLEAFRREFIADVSHELKTPIFAAQGFLHTLLDGAIDDKAVRNKFLKKAAKSLDGLDRLVQDLLILSQIETGQIKMRFSKVDLLKLTEEVVDQFEGKAEKRDIALRVESDQPHVFVQADELRIGQVLTNLVSNAINHSFEGGEVIVKFSAGKKNVTTRVIDFGEGIPDTHQARIFERFYRVDKSRSREKGGTGLGLAIVKHILEGHHTKTHLQSNPGKGSVFSFKLRRYKGGEAGDDKMD